MRQSRRLDPSFFRYGRLLFKCHFWSPVCRAHLRFCLFFVATKLQYDWNFMLATVSIKMLYDRGRRNKS